MAFNPRFETAMDELLQHVELNKPPQVVRERFIVVLQKPLKLFCWVGNAGAALGADRIEPGLYASDLLVKLLEAVRALDWETVVVILEHAISPELEEIYIKRPGTSSA
jgi:hypothetical protein